MPRSKTRKPKVQSDAQRRVPNRPVREPAQTRLSGLARRHRPSGRPLRVPGRGGGR